MSRDPIESAEVELAGGVRMPAVAFGCAFGDWVGKTDFQGFLPEQAWRAMTLALEAGYRSFDGAHAYGTESILGTILGQRFASGDLAREDLFLTSKLAHPAAPPHVNISHLRTWNAAEIPDVVQRLKDDLARTLDELHVGYLDLLLVHWPGTFDNEDAPHARRTRRAIWETFVGFREKGAARAIGVSNFGIDHLRQLMEDVPGERPAVNQIEVHPYCRDPELERFCSEQGIRISAYAPFASGAFGMLEDPTITSIAQAHDVSVGQAILRWHVQSGRTVLPKSSNARRMAANRNLFDFALTAAEMAAIDALGAGEPQRTCPDPGSIL